MFEELEDSEIDKIIPCCPRKDEFKGYYTGYKMLQSISILSDHSDKENLDAQLVNSNMETDSISIVSSVPDKEPLTDLTNVNQILSKSSDSDNVLKVHEPESVLTRFSNFDNFYSQSKY